MILLEDSDLYAAISYLRIKRNNMHYLNYIKKIWIQERIKEKFLWLMEKYFKDQSIPICIFRSKQELFTLSTLDTVHIVSIWSEDIVVAKNLATSLNVFYLNDVIHCKNFLTNANAILFLFI